MKVEVFRRHGVLAKIGAHQNTAGVTADNRLIKHLVVLLLLLFFGFGRLLGVEVLDLPLLLGERL